METYAALSARVLAAPRRLGATRLVVVDGPAGSGKTTFAERLAGALGEVTGGVTGGGSRVGVLHMDEVYAGWTLTGAAARLASGVLRPIAEERAGAYHRYDWSVGRFAPAPVPVPAVPLLLVEGCGSCPQAQDPWTTLRIWVEAPPQLCLERGLARDGAGLAPQWRRWQELEAAVFATERTRARADLLVDGAAEGAHPEVSFVPLR